MNLRALLPLLGPEWASGRGPMRSGNPLPPVVHAELAPGELGDGRVLVIGDVHGCPGELKALLKKYAAPWSGSATLQLIVQPAVLLACSKAIFGD